MTLYFFPLHPLIATLRCFGNEQKLDINKTRSFSIREARETILPSRVEKKKLLSVPFERILRNEIYSEMARYNQHSWDIIKFSTLKWNNPFKMNLFSRSSRFEDDRRKNFSSEWTQNAFPVRQNRVGETMKVKVFNFVKCQATKAPWRILEEKNLIILLSLKMKFFIKFFLFWGKEKSKSFVK